MCFTNYCDIFGDDFRWDWLAQISTDYSTILLFTVIIAFIITYLFMDARKNSMASDNSSYHNYCSNSPQDQRLSKSYFGVILFILCAFRC